MKYEQHEFSDVEINMSGDLHADVHREMNRNGVKKILKMMIDKWNKQLGYSPTKIAFSFGLMACTNFEVRENPQMYGIPIEVNDEPTKYIRLEG